MPIVLNCVILMSSGLCMMKINSKLDFADRKVQEKLAEGEEQTESSLASSNHVRDESQRDPDVQKASADDRSSGSHADKTSTDESGLDSADGQKVGRPMSPGTLALMCDEQDTMFMTSRNPGTSPRFPCNQSVSQVYADQERGVLTAFRDSLLKLINCGRMKGKFAFQFSWFSQVCCFTIHFPSKWYAVAEGGIWGNRGLVMNDEIYQGTKRIN